MKNMPRITSITLENFKGISEPVTIPIRPITLLFGKNSAGKSTILQAMMYTLEVLRTGEVDIDAVCVGGDTISLGGFDNIIHNHKLTGKMKIRFNFDYSSVDWHKDFFINEYINGNSDMQDDLSTIGTDIETGWVSLEITRRPEDDIDPDSVNYWDMACPTLENIEVGFDDIPFAEIRRWFDHEFFSKTDNFKKAHKGKVILNRQHPLLLLPGESVEDATNNIYDKLVNRPEHYLWEYFYFDFLNQSKFVLDHTDVENSLIQNLESLGEDYYAKLVPELKLQSNLPETEFVPGTFECFYDSRIEAVTEVGQRIDNRLGVYRVFHFNPNRGNVTDVEGWSSSPVIESMNGDVPDYNGRLQLGFPVSDILRSGDSDDSEMESSRNPYADALFIEQMISRLCIGPISMLVEILESMTYIGPIRQLPSSEYANKAAIKKDTAKWATGLAAWDQAALWENYASSPKIDYLNHYLDDVLKTGYRFCRRQVGEIEPMGGIFNAIWDMYNNNVNAEHLLEEFRGRLPELYYKSKTKFYLQDLKNDIEVSPADVGVGISQVFPVVVSAVMGGNLCVEQPELHLHPAMQCELGDMFIRESNKNRIFLIETHSEHLILRLMKRIRQTAKNELPDKVLALTKDEMQVLFVENVNGRVFVRDMPLNEHGDLVKAWPGGFFEEGLEEVY